MTMLLDQEMSIFPVDKWQHTQYDRCKSYQIVCTWLHTGHAKQPFALKGCRNPARHIFPWLPGEAVGLCTGVLTKMFAMSVLYLKSELNCGLGAINGEDASKAGGHGSQMVRFLVRLRSVQLGHFPVILRTRGHLARLSVSLRIGRRSHASRSVKVK